MSDALVEHLTGLPRPQLSRVALSVLGVTLNGVIDGAARAIAAHLRDPAWVRSTLDRLGPDAQAALAAVARAGVPVLRRDVSALVTAHDADPVDALEDFGLLTPVRTGRGMPTHVALPPELAGVVEASLVPAADGAIGRGPAFAGARRRFELALMLAAVGQHPPRLTQSGRFHGADLARLAHHLAPLGLHAEAIERRLLRWADLGVAVEQGGVLRLTAAAFDDVTSLAVLLALAQLAAPSTPEGTLRIVGRLLATGAALPLRHAIDHAQAALLRDRAGEAGTQRGARSELLDVIRSLLSLDSIVLQDESGAPLPAEEMAALDFSQHQPVLALEPMAASSLLGLPRPSLAFARGHVQSSFEIVADSASDPTLVARVAVWSQLVRADRAAVLRLERGTIARAKALGFDLESLLSALGALGDAPIPGNVRTILHDWFAAAPASLAVLPRGQLPEIATLIDDARAATLPAADES